jgi:hypothetical protein
LTYVALNFIYFDLLLNFHPHLPYYSTMQAPVSETEKSTVFVTTINRVFRVWFNPAGYWQTDLRSSANESWMYFGCASTLIAAMANLGAAI